MRNTETSTLLVIFFLAACAPVAAADGGSIAGTVADSTGAAMPSVAVTVRNISTAVVQSTITNSAGFYAFPTLAAGTYEFRAEIQDFKPYLQNSLVVASASALMLNIALELGDHNEAITITEAPLQLEAANTQMGDTIGSAKITNMPVNGRSYTDLLALQPGVTPVSSKQPNAVVMSGCAAAPPSGDLNPGDVSVSGQRETSNGFVVNGSSVQEDFNMFAAVIPNLDSIREFRVLTSNFDAEYGNFSGGQIVVTTKGGENQVHGSAFEFLRNTNLSARNFFAPERARYDRNQFGGTIGAPIRRDKIFFFGDYQGTRMTRGVDTGLIILPSQAARSGDLSGMAATLNGTVNGDFWANRLSQRLGYSVRPGEPYYTPGCTSSLDCVLPYARIPERAWSAPAKALLPYIPLPNLGSSQYSTSAYNETLRDDKGSLRIDANSRWGAVSAYYFFDDYSSDNPYPTAQAGANVPGFNALTLGRAQLATTGITTTLDANTVNELRLSYMRTANKIGKPLGGVGPTLISQGFVDSAGKPGIVPLAPAIEGIENVVFNDFTMGVNITGVVQANNTYQFSDNFSRVAGRHLLKVGAGMHLDQINIAPNATYNGSFMFNGTETGSDYADYLLGIASVYAQGDSRSFYPRTRYAGLFAQDSWQVRHDLTLNYGVRWDLLPPWREKFNQLQTAVLGLRSIVYPGAPAGLVFPGDPGIPDTLAPARYTNFAPRLGLAWSPDFSGGKTILRAGYGIYYTAIEGLSAGIMSANPPYGMDFDSFGPPLFETPFVIAATGQDTGQRFPSPIAAPGASPRNPNNTVDWSMYLPIAHMPGYDNGNVTPYTENFTISIERALARNTSLKASYLGAQAHHLLVLESANPGNPALCLSVSRPEDVLPGTPTCGPFGENNTYYARDGRIIQGTRGPFGPDFAGFTFQKTIGNSNYNALEVSLHHSSQRLDLLLGYTYGKSIDQSSSLSEAVNPFNNALSRAISAFDIKHNFVGSASWNLPFEQWLRHKSRWTQGWALSSIARLSSGLPVTLFNNTDTSLAGTIPNGINSDGVDMPDYTPGNLSANTNPRNGRAAFNTALFHLPSPGEMGTASRRFFYGPGMVNFDIAVHKRLPISENRALEFRLEAFNTFNHAQFFGAAGVNGNITSPAFGQVVAADAPRVVQLAMKLHF